MKSDPVRYRVGRSLGRTLYRLAEQEPSDRDVLIGIMDRQDDAAMVVEALNGAPAADRLHLRVEPGMRFGAPHTGGCSAESVAGTVASGDGVDVACDEYDLTRPEVLLCCWFMAMYGAKLAGDPCWDAWDGWLREHYQAMARSNWDHVPDPPAFPPVGGDPDVQS